MGLYDNILAQERERVAMAAIDVPAAQATQYGAARGMERMKQGVESMLGIENPAITAHKKQAARKELLDSILTQFPNMETRADYIGAINKLYASGFIEEANKVASMLKDIPEATDNRTEDTKKWEYMQGIAPELQQQYQDFVNPSSVPNTWAEYIRTDDTPTGAEFVTYMGSGNVEQTKEYRVSRRYDPNQR